ncbi:carbohydrate ABC transporter permease [Halothermothrix orenii]|uniref:Binding-protein-dependent transport systems inner membrane component n=1 Tax=Halothermothrix orenii (strain H 168 / OCM 544 / DSM 9562) TaxID=373903 RepID=B8CXP9_HALOH|nr:carbohydrate ABC transporter permease [Halothermothrix orenii]ACL70068.1 binding-protein-dependent transport systems inner membrane component [Halothermothrix orenii H 168]
MGTKVNLKKIILNVILLVIVITWVLPTLGLLVTSFRPSNEIMKTGWWTVLSNPLKITQFTLENYKDVLKTNGVANAFKNSFFITIIGCTLPVIVASFAAFGLSKLNLEGKKIFYGIVLALMVVPIQLTFIPVLKLYNTLGLSGSFLGVWLAHTAYGLPFAIYMLHNYFQSLPDDLFEAASIDGASVGTMFFRLALPLSTPALASLVIFQFLWVWNDLLVALIYLGGSPDVAPLTLRLSTLVGSHGQSWHLLTSAAFISMVIPLIIFFTLQKYFVRGMLAGSVKG